MKKIFIDGKEGTTGLRIYDRLEGRGNIERIVLPEDERKNTESRRRALNEADIAFLCLPDAAAIEAAELVTNPDTVIIDTSTAHRTSPGWIYGFPELSEEYRRGIKESKRIAVPGCHASGFIALVKPLISGGILSADTKLTCFSLTGYSGGGKKTIAQYDAAHGDCGREGELLHAPRQYALGQSHKHLKEMTAISGLSGAPVFCPIISDFYSGMEVTVPVFASELKNGASVSDIKNIYKSLYTGPVVSYAEGGDEGGFLSSAALSGKDSMEISVYGNDERILLTARYDNLGKGASGAAVQCLNILLGSDETLGLDI